MYGEAIKTPSNVIYHLLCISIYRSLWYLQIPKLWHQGYGCPSIDICRESRDHRYLNIDIQYLHIGIYIQIYSLTCRYLDIFKVGWVPLVYGHLDIHNHIYIGRLHWTSTLIYRYILYYSCLVPKSWGIHAQV